MLHCKYSMKREYLLRITINARSLSKVRIDPHYETKHADVMNDSLILDLVRTLNGRRIESDHASASKWEFYCMDPLYFGGKTYRLIWCLHPDESYVGVINAFRR